jgi:hypothetical protein
MTKLDYHVKYFLTLVAVGVAMCLVGYQSYKGQSVKTLLIQNNSRSLQTVGSCEPGKVDEVWSPCYTNDILWGMNRDAKGAQWCRGQGFDGVDPWGYSACVWPISYKFKCAITHSRDWSPCYRDEDARAMGYKNRDDAGLKWCNSINYNSVVDHRDCGNWYFTFRCTHWSPCFAGDNRDGEGGQWCRRQGYDGVDPKGYEYCHTSWFQYYYKFKCANTHSIDWSPCYCNQDARLMGLGNRDGAGLNWCKNQGYTGVDQHSYC